MSRSEAGSTAADAPAESWTADQVRLVSKDRSRVVVQVDARASAFVNRCPHAGARLDATTDEVVDPESGYLVCSVHGAKFDPLSGLCIAGPCKGKSLTPASEPPGS